MSFTDFFADPGEPSERAFERLLKKYEPMIISTVRRYAAGYARHIQGAADREDLMQIARIAFWEANCLFDPAKVGRDKTPEHVFIAFAAATMCGRLSDRLRKVSKLTSRETPIINEETVDYPDSDSSSRSTEKQLHDLVDGFLSLLSPRERQYLHLSLFKDWDTRQIAEAARVSEHTVRSWKKTLRKKLEPLRTSLLQRN
ncbi:sigma-70 family RNA polymerase sigma factor [Sporolactobacillus sp. KGMB 08714]|uniref:sigma-70 family RNA polymerase sigma factor n=1 Tax=Sporolactobacillus sp. KGMB 08714 TaxID=3064704 RepID=UPI002FBE9F3A